MKKLTGKLGLALTLVCTALACNNTDFKGQSRTEPAKVAPPPAPAPAPVPAPPALPAPVTPAPPAPLTKELAITCDQLLNPTTSVLEVHKVGGQDVHVQVKGELCPKVAETLTVLFIVDWSGSMADNDPASGGACGRSQAAQAILNSIKTNSPSNVSVSVGMIPFSTSVPGARVIPLTSLDSFAPQVSESTFCQHSGSTNYIAAFSAAQSLLSGVTGRKVIYFISDGLPNIDATGSVNQQANPGPNSPAVTDSIAAGQALLASDTDITLDSLLLASASQGAAEAAQASNLMVQIAGSADRAKVVNDASQLATAILNFPPVALDSASVKATLSSPSVPETAVSLATFATDPSRQGVWLFETQPLTLEAKAQATVDNLVKVTVKSSDGTDQTATVTVRYISD